MEKATWYLHYDIDYCYPQCEIRENTVLEGKAVAVGGDAEMRHGIILSKSPLAKKYGVKTGSALWEARQRYPNLIILPANFSLYKRYTDFVRDIMRDYTPQLEPFGLDEAWIQIPAASEHAIIDLAEQIRRRVRKETGLTISIGISFNKVMAKLGSDYQKPNGKTLITRDNFREKVWPLPVSDLLYVGRATDRKFQKWSIRTIGDLAKQIQSF